VTGGETSLLIGAEKKYEYVLMMKFTIKDVIIGVLVATILLMILSKFRYMSFADEMNTSSPSPSPGPVQNSSSLSVALPSGAILPKTAEETCQTKYGDGWLDFSPMLCKKL
jgi:hypothetical protein